MDRTARIRRISLANMAFSSLFTVVLVVIAVLFVAHLVDVTCEPEKNLGEICGLACVCILACVAAIASLATTVISAYILLNARKRDKQERIRFLALLLKSLAPLQLNAGASLLYEKIAKDAERNAELIRQGCSFPGDR